MWTLDQGNYQFLLQKTHDADLVLSAGPARVAAWDAVAWARLLALARAALHPQGNAVFVLAPAQAHLARQGADSLKWEYYELICPTRPYDPRPTRGRPVYSHRVALVLPRTPLGSVYRPLSPRGGREEVYETRHEASDPLLPTWNQPGSVLPREKRPQEEQELFGQTWTPPLNQLTLLVRMYSNPGGLVADPFAGPGAVGVAAVQAGRRFTGAEVRPEQVLRGREVLLRVAAG